MKRALLLVLVILTILSLTFTAIAEVQIKTTDKILFTKLGEWTGYFFGKVENTGKNGVYLDYSGALVGYDEADNIILTESYVKAYPYSLYLAPGEYAYVREYILENNLKTSEVSDYKFSIQPDKSGYKYRQIECEATLYYNEHTPYDNCIGVTITNNTGDMIDAFAVTVALYDQNGNLIFVNGDYYLYLSIHPESTVTAYLTIDSAMAEYYAKESLVPTTVDALVYIEE